MGFGGGAMRSVARTISDADVSDVATVSWLAYAAPQEFPDALNPAFARAGEADLRSFTEGLRASNEHLPVW